MPMLDPRNANLSAEAEQDIDKIRNAIAQLGAMGAKPKLAYVSTSTNHRLRKEIGVAAGDSLFVFGVQVYPAVVAQPTILVLSVREDGRFIEV